MTTAVTYIIGDEKYEVVEQAEDGTGAPFWDVFDVTGRCLNYGEPFWDLPSLGTVEMLVRAKTARGAAPFHKIGDVIPEPSMQMVPFELHAESTPGNGDLSDAIVRFVGPISNDPVASVTDEVVAFHAVGVSEAEAGAILLALRLLDPEASDLDESDIKHLADRFCRCADAARRVRVEGLDAASR